ncbi:MAG: nitroreductase [Flavobacteriales bacterium]|nr:nitroreductase [Flavobacteriales bacterium]
MKYNLSEVVELIRDRRSIRPEQYTDRKVHPEIVESVLNSALWAPSHGMTQPWRFKVFTDDALNRLGQDLPALYREVTPADIYNPEKEAKLKARFEKITVLVAICLTPDPHGKIPLREERAAVACGVQNMMLHCTAYGLGSFWSSPKFCYTQEMVELLGLGEKDECLGLFYMGYPEIEWPKSHRRPLEYVTEWVSD